MNYLKSIYEQKISKKEWSQIFDSGLSKRMELKLMDVWEKGLMDGIQIRTQYNKIKVDDGYCYLHMVFLDRANMNWVEVHQMFESFNQLLDYIRLYTNITDEEYMDILKRNNFTLEDFPSGYGYCVVRKREIGDVVKFFFNGLTLIDKIDFSIRTNIYDFELVKKYVRSDTVNEKIFNILLNYDVKSVIPYIKRIGKYDFDVVVSHILNFQYDEDVFDCLLKYHIEFLVKSYISILFSLPKNIEFIIDKTISKIIEHPYGSSLLNYWYGSISKKFKNHSGWREGNEKYLMGLFLDIYTRKIKNNNRKKLDLLRTSLVSYITPDMIKNMDAEKFVIFEKGEHKNKRHPMKIFKKTYQWYLKPEYEL